MPGVTFKYLDRWYEQPLGAAFAEIQKSEIKSLLPQFRGNQLLQLGFNPGVDLKAAEIACSYLSLAPDIGLKQSDTYVVGSYHSLPFLADSIDIVMMNQVLEFESNLQHVLAEIHRVLTPEGKVMILGFNAFSSWGLIHFLKKRQHKLPWRGHFHTPFELKNALQALGFDILESKTFFFRPPIQNVHLLKICSFLEKIGSILFSGFGAGYLLIAQKKVLGTTPLRSRWQLSEIITGKDVKPAARVNFIGVLSKRVFWLIARRAIGRGAEFI